ncbi:LapB repeat-containing protein [Listeria costaricensis]|uniref:LapB repeat-containing protein n=1 Tax=Listeria costaricensis TaxID=2026604 RepID=UPI000C06E418|nr:LapB repeat-containing protein [Listeria costaricensis]
MKNTSKKLGIPLIAILKVLSPLTPLADTTETVSENNATETSGSGQGEQTVQNQTEGQSTEGNLKAITKTFNDWFPDDNLAKAVANELNRQPSDSVSLDELGQMEELDCSGMGIKDMSGLEYLSGLVFLSCYNNELTTLDASKNQNLEFIGCDNNQLTELDISQNKNINTFSCENNQLTELDVSQNLELVNLYCGGNQLTTIHFNSGLGVLYCENNQLTELDLSAIDSLDALECGGNQLTELDVSKHTQLGYLGCAGNQLTDLDLSQNLKLDTLDCSNNQLTELDLSQNPSLSSLLGGGNQLTTLDLSQNSKVVELDLPSNQLTTLDLSNIQNLSWLNLDNNKVQDFSFIPSNVIVVTAIDQKFTLDLQKGTGGKLTVPVSTELKDEVGAAMMITPSDNGVYDPATNTITWENLPASGEVSYSFISTSGFCGGTFTIPYQVTQPISLTADDEITYNQTDTVSEAQFLQDVHAQTEAGNQLSSDFETIVDFSTPGDYEVTITASNGTETVEKKVVVHVAVTEEQPVTPGNDSTDGETSTDQDVQKNANTSADQNVAVKVNPSNDVTQKMALPKTGDQGASGWMVFGSAVAVLGVYLLRRKK